MSVSVEVMALFLLLSLSLISYFARMKDIEPATPNRYHANGSMPKANDVISTEQKKRKKRSNDANVKSGFCI